MDVIPETANLVIRRKNVQPVQRKIVVAGQNCINNVAENLYFKLL